MVGSTQNLPWKAQLPGNTPNNVSEGLLFSKRGKPRKMCKLCKPNYSLKVLSIPQLLSLPSLGSETVNGLKWSGWQGGAHQWWKTEALEA